MSFLPVIITDSAYAQLKQLMSSSNEEVIRFGVRSGGCSGFTFFLEFNKLANITDYDELVNLGDVKLVVDNASLIYIIGTTIDWVEDIMGSHFVFVSPNQNNICKCGNSVSFKA